MMGQPDPAQRGSEITYCWCPECEITRPVPTEQVKEAQRRGHAPICEINGAGAPMQILSDELAEHILEYGREYVRLARRAGEL